VTILLHPIPGGGETNMEWTAPEFVEVKMDAEINSYQDDFVGI
jgi:coenzyme PQQ precursor peptide PqqA